ncbi:MAG: hypothetical protein H0T46_20735 [Deltaproteobacteria bacterium]|nr:hypothetical protein [Deltaproteobacteria bacterium]
MYRSIPLTASIAALAVIACSRSDRESRVTAPPTSTPTATPHPLPAKQHEKAASGPAWWGWLRHFTRPTRAAGVTPLDEVPDSTWFTNRNGVRPLSPESIRKGPGPHAAPRDGATWTVIGMKQTGVALGLRARDEAGDTFFLKFDPKGHDEVETGADVVVQRLLFAAGYNVPENDVVYLTREGLSLASDAKQPLRDADIDALLARAAREPDGRYRALASRFIPGKPIGGIAPLGTREGDPNDHIAHEDRRDMRGFYALAAWVNHTDMKLANTAESWIPDGADATRGHVVHYLLDFGKALGAMSRIEKRLDPGFAYFEEAQRMIVKQAATGAEPPWAGIGPFPELRGLGWIESERFDPATWKCNYRWIPFEKADRFDKLWGARLVASFTPPQIEAAVQAARYSEPRTAEYLTRVLVERQRKVLDRLFRGVAPLERFEVRGGALCFVDLWKRHALGGPEAIYRMADQVARATPDGSVCFERPPAEPVGEIRVERAGHHIPTVAVHVAGSRVTAIERR